MRNNRILIALGGAGIKSLARLKAKIYAENWTDFIKLVAEKLSIPSMHERTFADMETIKQLKTQIEELRTNLVL